MFGSTSVIVITAGIYKMTQKDNHLVFTINREPNLFILLLSGLWSLGWVGLMVPLVYGLSTDTDKLDAEIILFLTFFFLAGLFALKTFLWHLRGQEKVTFDDKELKIEKLGTILTTLRKFETQELDGFSLTEKPTTPMWIKFWGLGGGQIQFNYLGQTKYFGQTLTKNDANIIISKLNDRLKTTNR